MTSRNWFIFLYYYLNKLVTFVALGYITAIWIIKFPLGLVYRVINGEYAGSFYSIEYIVSIGGIILLFLPWIFKRSTLQEKETSLTEEIDRVMKEQGF